MLSSVVMFTCHALNGKFTVLTKLVQKTKTFWLRRYLSHGLVWIHWNWWWCSFVLHWTKKKCLTNLVQNQNCLFQINLVSRLIWTCRILLDLKCKFEASFFQKIKIENDETWCLDWFWYGVSDGYIGYFFFRMKMPFNNKIDETWCLG